MDYMMGTPEELELRAEREALILQLQRAESQLDRLSVQLQQLALDADPLPQGVRQAGVGGANAYAAYDRFDARVSEILKRTTRKLDELERQYTVQRVSYEELLTLARKHEEALRQLPAILPAEGRVVSGFGRRFHPVYKAMRMHQGIDILVNTGTPVVASADGIVIFVGWKQGYGRTIKVKHPETGYITLYAHLSKFAKGLRRGRRVKRGEVIGWSGHSGVVSGPHLHYEVRTLQNRPINPISFFAPGMTPEAYRELVRNAESATSSLD